MNSTYDNIIYLCRVELGFVKPDKARAEQMEKETIYNYARHHSLAPLVAYGFEACGCEDEKSRELIAKAYRREVMFDNALSSVKNKLNSAGIWYMPLKGAILKEYYPKCGMRTFSDYDILCDPSRMADVRDIMVSLGFDIKKYDTVVEDVYTKKPLLNFEMHRRLFMKKKGEPRSDYYEEVMGRLQNTHEFEYAFTDEDFYVYMIAHDYKHFETSGSGIRSLVDTYIYLISKRLDMAYVKRECEKIGIADFEEKNRKLAVSLMEGRELDRELAAMYEYIVESGTCGNKYNGVKNDLKKNGISKPIYVLRRFMVPVKKSNWRYEDFEHEYPFFYKHKILLIFLPGYRIIRSWCSGRLMRELRALVRVDKKDLK